MTHTLIEKERPTTVTIIVDEALREQLTRVARANERSVGAEIRVALRAHLERDDDKEGGDG
jgi:predicted transcriptional regulator